MLLALECHQYNKDFILFSEKTKNNILSNGDFYRIFYSPSHFTTTGIFIQFNLKSAHLESYFNKVKCTFDLSLNKNIIDFIRNLENDILAIVPTKDKNKVCRIDEQLSQGFIKIFSYDEYKKASYNDINILLKISGVWSDSISYGVTFRFFFIRQ